MKFETLSDALDYAYGVDADDNNPIYIAMSELETRLTEVALSEQEKVTYFNLVLSSLIAN